MSPIATRRTFLETAQAYTRSNRPPSQLTFDFIAAFTQMMADDCGGAVSVVPPGDIKISREPQ